MQKAGTVYNKIKYIKKIEVYDDQLIIRLKINDETMNMFDTNFYTL